MMIMRPPQHGHGGLARVEPTTSDTLIAFAAKAGSVAIDGEGTHSPFTTALLKHIITPGLDVRIAFGRVRDEVLKSTGNKQEPFVYGSLGGGNVTLVSLSSERIRTDATPEAQSAEIEGGTDKQAGRDYELAAQVGTKEAFDAFLAKHPTGFYAELARAQRAKAFGADNGPDRARTKPKLAAIPQDSQPEQRRRIKVAPSPGDPGRKKDKGKLAGKVCNSDKTWCMSRAQWCKMQWESAKRTSYADLHPSAYTLVRKECGRVY